MLKAGSFLNKQELNCRDEKEITVRFESLLTQYTLFFSLSWWKSHSLVIAYIWIYWCSDQWQQTKVWEASIVMTIFVTWCFCKVIQSIPLICKSCWQNKCFPRRILHQEDAFRLFTLNYLNHGSTLVILSNKNSSWHKKTHLTQKKYPTCTNDFRVIKCVGWNGFSRWEIILITLKNKKCHMSWS